MTIIAVNSSLGLGLDRVTGPVTLCDEHGRVLGEFVPSLHRPEDGCLDSTQMVRQAMNDALANPREGESLTDFWRRMGRTT